MNWIVIKTRFEGYHRWVNAPDEVAFLRDYHRHLFYVQVHIGVTDLDRELEFFMVKKRLDSYIKETYDQQYFDYSCEHIATDLIRWVREEYGETLEVKVSVFEDDENGAIIESV